MSLSAKIRRAPLRITTGAYILNSGVGKLGADDDTAKKLHGMASNTYGFLGKMQPSTYAKVLGAGEIAVGSALLLPIVPPLVAGAALAGFSGLLLNTYWNTPGMHEEGNPRPTAAGAPVAKDVWMFGMGTGLIADAMLEPAHDKRLEVSATVAEKRAEKSRRAKRKAAKQAAKAAKKSSERAASGRAALAEVQEEAATRARKAARQARQAKKDARKRAEQAQKDARKRAEQAQGRAREASDKAAKRLQELRADYVPAAAEKAQQARDTVRHVAERVAS
jgi:uncharacterized membrane protein YphA (DoxX/SURF4 family)